MNPKFVLFFACFTAICGVLSSYLSYQSIVNQRTVNGYASVGSASMQLATQLQDPEILALHGISEADLKQNNIELKELSYMVASLTMGETYYRLRAKDVDPVELTEYRRNFLSQPKVQTAWKKLIRGRLFSSSPYTEAVDKFIGQSAPTPKP